MRVSASLMDCLSSMFSGVYEYVTFSGVTPLSLSQNELFKVFIHTRNLKDEVLIPVIARGYVELNLHKGDRSFFERPSATMSMNLLIDPLPCTVKAASTVWRYAKNRIGRIPLSCVRSNKGEQYYVGNGCVLDSDFNPLMVSALRAQKREEGMFYTGIVLYINPQVMGSTGFLEKNIRNMVIPSLATKRLHIASRYSEIRVFNHSPFAPEVLITDTIRDFISVPEKPAPSTFRDSDVHRVLLDNIDDVIQIYES